MSSGSGPHGLEGRTIHASDGEKLGKVDSVLIDESGKPQYVEVRSGWFGSRRHTIPASALSPRDDDDLDASYTKEQLESAPTFDEGEDIDYERERAIGSYYGTDVRDWDDRRDNWLAGEDLSRGPTPETRHPAGHVEGRDLAEHDSATGETHGLDDVRDTTQGPTPETRQAMRLTDDDPAAAGQPSMDRRTRGDVGGNQDRDVAFGDRAGESYDAGTTGSGRLRLRRWVQTEDTTTRT